jgi:dipeptide/tripeptide permease
MELMERMAYYGVRLVTPVYIVLSTNEGGAGLNHVDKGLILACWAAMQSWLPTFAGGFSDRFGYKRTIAVSVILKTLGYAGMAMAGDFWTMLAGTQMLAAGTGLFKPGIQGTMAHSIARTKGSPSMGWGLFYQSVNVGAAVSAYIPAFTRDVYGWSSVFWACSAIVLSNLIPLFFYEDPKDERQSAKDERSVGRLIGESVRDLFTSPVLMGFILISAGFWFTFHQLFDMLPNYVDDWTDSSVLLRMMGETFGNEAWVAEADAGKMIPQERLLNINALMIMFTMFFFAWVSSKMKVLTSTILGMGIATLAILPLGWSADVFLVLSAVVMFTIGEMWSSPKRQEYLSALAPAGKRALYLGYANMPDGIGWVLGSLVAGSTYEEKGDKINLARRYLSEHPSPMGLSTFERQLAATDEGTRNQAVSAIIEQLGLPETTAAAEALAQFMADPRAAALVPEVLPRGLVIEHALVVIPAAGGEASMTAEALRELLFATYQPGQVWLPFVAMGGVSVVLMVVYDRWVRARLAREAVAAQGEGHADAT